MSERLPVIGLALLLIGLLALIISGTFGEVVVVPLLFLWWAMQVLYQSIPQALLWGVFVVIAVLLVAKNFPGAVSASARRDANCRAGTRGRLVALAARFPPRRSFALAAGPAAVTAGDRDAGLPRAVRAAGDQPAAARRIAGYSAAAARLPARRQRAVLAKAQAASALRPADAGHAHAEPLATDPQLVIDYLEETVQHTIGAT